MMKISVEIPFGSGEATIMGDYSPEEPAVYTKTSWLPVEPRVAPQFDVEGVIVGGVDIFDELPYNLIHSLELKVLEMQGKDKDEGFIDWV